jgi:Tol biopolymer transport system component
MTMIHTSLHRPVRPLAIVALLFVSVVSTGLATAEVAAASPATEGATVFVPVTPCRVVDTRAGAGGRLAAGAQRSWHIRGSGSVFAAQGGKANGCGIPASATAVAVSISSVSPSGSGYLRAWPTGMAMPTATLVQFVARFGTTNSATVALARTEPGADLDVRAFSSALDLVLDVQGYHLPVTSARSAQASVFVPLPPCRVVDTRLGAGGRLQPGDERTWQVAGQGQDFVSQGAGSIYGCGVPFGATAVSMSISTISPSGSGFLRAWPTGAPAPTATVLQFSGSTGTTNTAAVAVNPDQLRGLTVRGWGSATGLAIDVGGYYRPETWDRVPEATVFVPTTPCRAVDTRKAGGTLTPGVSRTWKVAGTGTQFAAQGGQTGGCGVPASATAVHVAVSAVSPSGSGYLRVGPAGDPRRRTFVQYAGSGTTNAGTVALAAEGLTADANGTATQAVVDVFGYEMPTSVPLVGATTRIASTLTDSRAPSISDDGRWVVHEREVENPEPGTGGRTELWLWDAQTKTSTRIAGDTGDSYAASISGDGSTVVFLSSATDLVAGDTNGWSDVFVWDRATKVFERLTAADWPAERVSVSDDGRHVAYQTYAGGGAGGNDNFYAIYVHDRQTDQTHRITPVGSDANVPAMSGNGQHVAFVCTIEVDLYPDVCVWSRNTGQVEVIADGNGYAGPPAISDDGRFVAFAGGGNDLVPSEPGRTTGVAVWDRLTDSIGRVGPLTVRDDRVAMSDDGRHLTFLARAPSQVREDLSEPIEVFTADRTNGLVLRITGGDDDSEAPAISGDGRYVAYASRATNLVAGDTNLRRDVFRWDRAG